MNRIWEVVLIENGPEDDLWSVDAIKRSAVPCHLTVFSDGAAALKYILDATPQPDLVVMDYHLPSLNGLEVLTELRSSTQSRYTRIVMFNSSAEGGDMRECLRAGATSCVTKPNTAKDYLDHLGSVIQYWLGATRPSGLDRLPQFAKAMSRSDSMASVD